MSLYFLAEVALANPFSGKNILVVENDSAGRNSIVEILRDEGFSEVFEAANGEDALNTYFGGDTRIDILLTDLDMPRVNGIQLAQTLRDRGFLFPIILQTGRPQKAAESKTLFHAILAKPFPIPGLLKALSTALSSPPAPGCSAGF